MPGKQGARSLSAIVAAALSGGIVFSWFESFSHMDRLLLGLLILLSTFVGMLFYVMGQRAFYLHLVRTLTRTGTSKESEA